MKIDSLAIFGGRKAFETPKSTSNLVRPSKENFLSYLLPDLRDGNLGHDSRLIDQFETRLASWHQANHCVSVVNGLWGLVLTIDAMRISSRREIIMPSMTYRRMADIAAWLKLTPHFCDVDAETGAICPLSVESCINEQTALILAPHPIVHLCDIEAMLELGKRYDIPVLFDSVEAVYATHAGRPVGSFGTEVFSMHASKFLNGFEGGYITTDNEELAEKLRFSRTPLHMDSGPMNALLPAPHAAMTLASLDDVPRQIEDNKLRFNAYEELLENFPALRLIKYSNKEQRNFKNIIVEISRDWILSREEIIKILQSENMVVRPYYYPPLHMKKTVYPTIYGDLPNTQLLMNNRILLPCGDFVTKEDIKVVVDYLKFIHTHQESIKFRLEKIN